MWPRIRSLGDTRTDTGVGPSFDDLPVLKGNLRLSSYLHRILDATGVMPDGLTVDAEGFVWVALWGGGALQRYSPDGSLQLTIDVPAVNVTSCAFGGRDLDILYITTAAGPGGPGGALFACEVGVTGLPANPYSG